MKIVPAKNGWLWLARGFRLFRKSPATWTLLVFTYWILIALLNQVPVAGPLIATLFLPAFSVSFMAMCDVLDRGGKLHPVLLFAGFRRELPTLVTMGGLYLASIMAVLALSALADGGALLNWIVHADAPPVSAIQDGSLQRAVIVAAVAGTPVVMAFWFAPVLAAWEGMGAAKALFFSFFAGLRNWRAFLIYGLALVIAGSAFSALLATATVLLRGNPGMARMLLFVAVLASLPTIFGSFYAAYRDVFPPSTVTDEPAAAA